MFEDSLRRDGAARIGAIQFFDRLDANHVAQEMMDECTRRWIGDFHFRSQRVGLRLAIERPCFLRIDQSFSFASRRCIAEDLERIGIILLINDHREAISTEEQFQGSPPPFLLRLYFHQTAKLFRCAAEAA